MNTFIELDKYGLIKLWLWKANFTVEQMGSKEEEYINRLCSHESWGWGRSDQVERCGVIEVPILRGKNNRIGSF